MYIREVCVKKITIFHEQWWVCIIISVSKSKGHCIKMRRYMIIYQIGTKYVVHWSQQQSQSRGGRTVHAFLPEFRNIIVSLFPEYSSTCYNYCRSCRPVVVTFMTRAQCEMWHKNNETFLIIPKPLVIWIPWLLK